jgi:Uma2 family endonuclease
MGMANLAPADLDFEGAEVLQPDLFVVPLVQGREPVQWSEFAVPFLIVEVLSPSTARYDRLTKRAFFQQRRVADYWIVDVDARVVEHWRPDDTRPAILDQRVEWPPDPALPALVIELPGYFAEVWAEQA